MRNVKLRVRKILREINLDNKATEYFAEMVDHCIKKNISTVDINVAGELFPIISKKYDTTPCAVKSSLIRALKNSHKETDPITYHNTLNYSKRISIKKLIIILTLKLRKEEDEKVVKRKKA